MQILKFETATLRLGWQPRSARRSDVDWNLFRRYWVDNLDLNRRDKSHATLQQVQGGFGAIARYAAHLHDGQQREHDMLMSNCRATSRIVAA